ncbi:MAG: hypothetical protein AAB341_02315 [Planctomycetota bacterium]
MCDDDTKAVVLQESRSESATIYAHQYRNNVNLAPRCVDSNFAEVLRNPGRYDDPVQEVGDSTGQQKD